MKRFRFDAATSKPVTQFGSSNVHVTHLVKGLNDASVVCMQVSKGGMIGYHQTVENQLFLVVQGSGWVRGTDAQRWPITAGEAALWRAGEFHESGSEAGMLVIIVEGKDLQPTPMMQEIE